MLATAIGEHGVYGSPAVWARSVARGDLDPAECQPEPTIAFELTPVLADQTERQDEFAAGGRKIDPNLLPSIGTLVDPPSFETPGRTRHGSRCWIENDIAVICGRSMARR